MPRFYCPSLLQTGFELDLPAGAARHVQVLRLQPGDLVTLFNSGWTGAGVTLHQDAGEFEATILRMGRSSVTVLVGMHRQPEREPLWAVHLAVAMPANDRMDWLVEKATELGVAAIWPLISERSVLRLSGERAEKKVAHWQSIAIAASEQCGGNKLPKVHAMMHFAAWMQQHGAPARTKAVLSLQAQATSVLQWKAKLQADVKNTSCSVMLLSGPEGGLSPLEEETAIQQGFKTLTLGSRILRAETAALTALTSLVVS